MRTSIGTVAAAALAIGLLAAACTDGAVPPTGGAGAAVPLGDVKLVAYSDCDDMLEGLRAATAENVGPYGLGGDMIFAAGREVADGRMAKAESAPNADHSTTNVQEAGTDEPDLVKTDGRRILTYNRGVLRVVDAASRKVTGTVRVLPADQGWTPGDLLVDGDRALVLLGGSGGMIPLGATKRAAFAGPRYVLVDLKELKVIGSITPQGTHVDARMVGSTVRLVVRSQPQIKFPQPRPDQPEKSLLERNREVVASAPIDAWLPAYEVAGPDGRPRQEKVACEQVSHPETYTGTSMLTMHTVDLAAGIGAQATAAAPVSVAADGDTVYATATSLYVTSNPRWWRPVVDPQVLEPAPSTPQVDPGTGDTTTPSTGTAAPDAPGGAGQDGATPGAAAPSPPGTDVVAPKVQTSAPPAEKVEPSNDPSMPSLLPEPAPTATAPEASATPETPVTPVPSPTDTGTAGDAPRSATPGSPEAPPERTEVHRFDITGAGAPRYIASGGVPGRLLNQYSLSEHDGHLRVATTSTGGEGVVAADSSSGVYVLDAETLAEVGQVTGLGRGERIYSVRFIGPVGYVVTFRQVDPLYTLDLRDPAKPVVTGELKITGYSAYLHPAGEGRLLGIGQEASEKGRTLGTQVSLFDVSDPAKPARLSQFHQQNSGSEAEWDPHAFLYWPATGLAVMPLNEWGGRLAAGARSGALVLKIADDGITKTGVVTHPQPEAAANDRMPVDPALRRALVIGDTLWTVSDAGLKASDAATLDERGWIPFT
ncbi:beta-propeller domain-containing protein [Sphaerisporangium sp. TRM90804]|uniref:beta-propeller domain-containing protein n=1 Tax=Sphaerisporangium sp. TRM90804 TaxID=3031113 RepID=UPI002447AC23|nr:beta-propeller domain-containing protein [Sphaerisporangium sp. TRM90804]MDH2423862.1 beta-propeller domain-containing protein [Sphaerisporangium sp. TRM90804]